MPLALARPAEQLAAGDSDLVAAPESVARLDLLAATAAERLMGAHRTEVSPRGADGEQRDHGCTERPVDVFPRIVPAHGDPIGMDCN
jgi:hypothetical protein